MKKIFISMLLLTIVGYAFGQNTGDTKREIFYEEGTVKTQQNRQASQQQIERARQQAERAREEAQKIREEAQQQAAEAREEAQQEAQRIREEEGVRIREEGVQIREEARQQTGQAREQAQRAREMAERQTVEIEDRYYNPDRSVDRMERREYSITIPGTRRRAKPSLTWKDGHYSGLMLYYNGLISDLGNLKLPNDAKYLSLSAKSIGIALNPIDYALPIGRKFMFLTGLGFELNNFRFDNNITLTRQDGVTVPDYQYDDMGVHLKKSKLFTAYMNIPILAEVQLGRRNEFFITAGVVGGLRIGAHTKIKADDPQLKGKHKNHDNLGLRNLHYGFMFNAGFRNIALTMSYYPHSIFRSGQGPDVHQVNVGLGLLF